MSDAGSDSEECQSDLEDWSSGDDIPLAHFEDDGDHSLSLEEVLSEVIVEIGDKVACNSTAPRHLDLNFDLHTMPVSMRQALGLADIDFVLVTLVFDSNKFGAGKQPRCAVNCSRPTMSAAVQSNASSPTEQQLPTSLPPYPMPNLFGAMPIHDEAAQSNAAASDTQAIEKSAEEQSNSEDSDSSPSPNKRQRVATPVQFQLAQIATRRLAADWPQQRSARFTAAKSWIVNLHKYLATRLIRLGDVCVYCDAKQLVPGPKPVACERSMCRYQVDELGCGASMATIYQEPLVADLLISLAAKAAGNPNTKHRQRFFACPYPPSDFVDGARRTAHAADPDDNMGIMWTELQQVLSNLPTVNEMAAAKNLQAFLDKHDTRAYRLVRWVLATCRVHIVRLQPEQEIASMGGYQFKLFTNTFEREVAFQKLKKQHGSGYAFHGSGFMNWHSILRTSLQNFSNTSYMLNGASYGAGVYVATQASTSLGYSRRSPAVGVNNAGYKSSVFGTEPACLALAEVAKVADPPSNTRSPGIQVIQNHDAVVARYLFVYADGRATCSSASAETLQIPEWDDVCI